MRTVTKRQKPLPLGAEGPSVNPVNVNEHTWWYREKRGGMTLVREEVDLAGQHLRTRQYRLVIRRDRIVLLPEKP